MLLCVAFVGIALNAIISIQVLVLFANILKYILSLPHSDLISQFIQFTANLIYCLFVLLMD